jgi:Zn-dependent peptidase ImmA (M78 family)
MLLDGHKIDEVFKKIAAVQEHMKAYSLAPDRMKISIEDLQWCVADMYGIKIFKQEVSFDGEYVRGMLERYKDRAFILVRADQSDDWKRFVCIKELSHIVIDEQDDWSPKGTETIEALTYEAHIDSDELPAPNAQSEMLALIAAIELAYPYRDRLDDTKRLANKQTTIKKIALEYAVPQYAIGLSLHPHHVEIARMGWGEVGG